MNIRLTTLVLAGSMAVSLSAFAAKGAAYQAPAPEPEMARWTITGGATYLTPSLNGLDYLSVRTGLEDTASFNTYRVEPGYDFGYFIGLGYMISDRYDVQASWAQFDSRSTDSHLLDSVATGLDYLVGTSNLERIEVADSEDIFYAHAEQNMNFQVFDATLGQIHTLGDNLNARLFAGVRYAKIEDISTNNYSYNENGTVTTGFDRFDSSFSGVGPEVGLDLNYDVVEWFGIVGHFAAAFLVGTQDSSTDKWDDENTTGAQQTLSADDTTILVPAIDAKLGVSLGVPFMDMQDRFMMEAGYQVAYYFNSVDQVQMDGNDVVHNVSDVGMMGPYLNVGFKF